LTKAVSAEVTNFVKKKLLRFSTFGLIELTEFVALKGAMTVVDVIRRAREAVES